jgi:hypothetical protein
MEINAIGNKNDLEKLEELLKQKGLTTKGVQKSGVILSPLYTLRMRTKRGQKFDTSASGLHIACVSDSTDIMECADCLDKHPFSERIRKEDNGWVASHCPKCDSESYHAL